MKIRRSVFLYPIFLLVPLWIFGQGQSIEQALASIPDIKAKEMRVGDHFTHSYTLTLKQPLDHNHPEKGSFDQYIYLNHAGFDRPVVLETEGYAAFGNSTTELSHMLKANQIRVEYRYYGKSKPDSLDWQYLTNRQAAEDYHRITTMFKKIYPGKWVSSGISKGGETCLIYRRFYPDDVDATVPYVAPLNLGVEDPRTDEWQKTAGTAECRKKITDFQKLVLKKRKKVLASLERYTESKRLKVSMGLDAALEYMVLEYPFSFWQWGGDCEQIPQKKATPEAIYSHLQKTVSPWYYTDEGIAYYQASFYQHLRELGYYGYPHAHLDKYLKAVRNPTNADFAPQDVDLTYDATFIPDILDWLSKNGNNIIYIYGELDTWTACAVEPSPNTNAIKLVNKGGAHASRIKDLTFKQQQLVYDRLEKWLQLEVNPIEN